MAAEASQISVASNGKIKAVFSDGSVLILSAPGGLFAMVQADNVVKQTCEFAVSTFAEQLCAVMEFRNMHLDSLVWCRAMSRKHSESLFTTHYPISHVCWPSTVADAQASQQLKVRSPCSKWHCVCAALAHSRIGHRLAAC